MQETANKRCSLPEVSFLSVLVGVVIPSAVIKRLPPQEFIDINYFYHPLWFYCELLLLCGGDVCNLAGGILLAGEALFQGPV